MIKGLIFDMDGTVIDSTKSDYNAWKIIFQEYNYDFKYPLFLEKLGAKGEEIVQSLININQEETKEFLDKKEKKFKEIVSKEGLKTIKGIVNFLEEIKSRNIKIALATGSSKDKLEFIFNQVPIRKYFDQIITADDTDKGKPDPEVFLKAAKKLSINPDQAVVFEDAEKGIEAATNAGMKCIAILTTHQKQKLKKANLIIESYSELDIDQIFTI